MRRAPHVVVLGGGVAGMSAAHELAERGLRVTLCEARDVLGGKARSIGVEGTGQGGRRDLPGEHGFRFFPRFYRHVTDTMARIPFGRNPRGVADNLVDTSRMAVAIPGAPMFTNISRFPRTAEDLRTVVQALAGWRFPLDAPEVGRLFASVWRILSTCPERRAEELDPVTWGELTGMDEGGHNFQFLVGLTQIFVALRADRISACTTGSIALQMVSDLLRPGPSSDRVLAGPTSEAWLDPWREHLVRLGVDIRCGQPLTGLHVADGSIVAASLGDTLLQADQYVAAMPVEVMARFITPELARLDPALGAVPELAQRTRGWMTGAQLFLRSAPSFPHGHIIHMDSPWALTSVMHQDFWSPDAMRRYGDGEARSLLSIDISDWDAPGLVVRKPARQCTASEVKEEVWAQLEATLTGPHALRREDEVAWFLDPAVTPASSDAEGTNDDPLFVNTAGIRGLRPPAESTIANLTLAGDWVSTHTDLASMEGANEAARRAVNVILERTDVAAEPCGVWPHREPAVAAPLRAVDRLAWRLGRPWPWGPQLAPQRPTTQPAIEPAASPVSAVGELRQVG